MLDRIHQAQKWDNELDETWEKLPPPLNEQQRIHTKSRQHQNHRFRKVSSINYHVCVCVCVVGEGEGEGM